MEKHIDAVKLADAVRAIGTNILVNNHALERVAFCLEQPGDKVPVDLYLKNLNSRIGDGQIDRRCIPGIYIDAREHISAAQDYDEYVRDLFVIQMDGIFIFAPKDKRLLRDGEELPLIPRLRKYLFGLLPLFTDILKLEVEHTPFDIIPTDREKHREEHRKRRKFVTAILIKSLKPGSRISRYVKDFTDTPYYIERLIEKRGKSFYLKAADTSGYDFIFALFSLMQFTTAENSCLFELKMHEWERLHKGTIE